MSFTDTLRARLGPTSTAAGPDKHALAATETAAAPGAGSGAGMFEFSPNATQDFEHGQDTVHVRSAGEQQAQAAQRLGADFQRLGYTGPVTVDTTDTSVAPEYQTPSSAVAPQLKQWMDRNGYKLELGAGGHGYAAQLSGADGKPLLQESWSTGALQDLGRAATVIAGGYFGGGALASNAASAGAGAGTSAGTGAASGVGASTATGAGGGTALTGVDAAMGDLAASGGLTAGDFAGAGAAASGAGAAGGGGGGLSSADSAALHSAEGYGPGMTGAETGAFDSALSSGLSPELSDMAAKLAKYGVTAGNIRKLLGAGAVAGVVGGAVSGLAGGGDSGGSGAALGTVAPLQQRALPTLANLDPNAPGAATNPGIGQSQDAAAALRDSQIAAANANRAAQQGQIAQVQGVTDASVAGLQGSAARSSGIADMALGDYVGGYRPVQQQLIEQAQNMDSQAAQDKAAGLAATDTQRSIDAALAQQRRSMASMGINPGSMATPQRADIIRMAAQRAGAANVARRGLVGDANALRTQVAQMGQQTLNTSLSAGQAADASRTGAVNLAQTPFGLTSAGYNNYLAGTNAAGNSNTSAANIGLAGLGVNLDAYRAGQNATQQNNANALAGWQLQSNSDLDQARLAETGRQFNANYGLSDKQLSNNINTQNAMGAGSLAKWGIDNWGSLVKAGSSLADLFGD